MEIILSFICKMLTFRGNPHTQASLLLLINNKLGAAVPFGALQPNSMFIQEVQHKTARVQSPHLIMDDIQNHSDK